MEKFVFFRTGTEEEKTERGLLLEEIASIIAEEEAEINTRLGAEEDKHVPVASEGYSSEDAQTADKDRDNALKKFGM